MFLSNDGSTEYLLFKLFFWGTEHGMDVSRICLKWNFMNSVINLAFFFQTNTSFHLWIDPHFLIHEREYFFMARENFRQKANPGKRQFTRWWSTANLRPVTFMILLWYFHVSMFFQTSSLSTISPFIDAGGWSSSRKMYEVFCSLNSNAIRDFEASDSLHQVQF